MTLQNKKNINNINTKYFSGGKKKNLIEFLFGKIDEDKEDHTNKNDTHRIEKIINNSENILENWIQNTNDKKGMALYFAEEKDENSQGDENWLKGYHGKPLENDRFNLNEYVIKRLQNTDNQKYKECLENINQKSQICADSLTDLQINDINNISDRIELNNKVNKHLSELIDFKTKDFEKRKEEMERKIVEMEVNFEKEKEKFELHKENIHKIIEINNNFKDIIKEYVSDYPDYNKLKDTHNEQYTFNSKDLIQYIIFCLEDCKKKEIENNILLNDNKEN